jgi:hypothetical protein
MPPASTTLALNFPTGTACAVDSGGKFTEVGGPQISSASCKYEHLRTCKICYFYGHSANVAICGFADLRICGFAICDL